MTVSSTTCHVCGAEYEPDRRAIAAGTRHTYSKCQPVASEQPTAPTRCEGCGRALLAGSRTVCLGCLTGGSAL
jgi:hypothetical protein